MSWWQWPKCMERMDRSQTHQRLSLKCIENVKAQVMHGWEIRKLQKKYSSFFPRPWAIDWAPESCRKSFNFYQAEIRGRFKHFLKGNHLFTINQRVEKASQFPFQRFYFHRTAFEHAERAHLKNGRIYERKNNT